MANQIEDKLRREIEANCIVSPAVADELEDVFKERQNENIIYEYTKEELYPGVINLFVKKTAPVKLKVPV